MTPTEQEIARAALDFGSVVGDSYNGIITLPRKHFEAMRAALSLLRPIAEGTHGRFPFEPTDDMKWAGGQAQTRSIGSYGEPEVVYRAMLAAAKDAT